jgi:hypothetical protein
MDCHFIKEKLYQKIICFSFVKSPSQLADILIKIVSNKDFYSMIDKLDMKNIYTLTWKGVSADMICVLAGEICVDYQIVGKSICFLVHIIVIPRIGV